MTQANDPKVPSPFGFLREFLRNPRQIGAVVPSSDQLAAAMVEGLPLDSVETLVELGPGTGALTEYLLARLPSNSRYLAVEQHAGFAQSLREKYPRLEVTEGCASRLPELLAASGLPGCDLVVSGLPWAIFGADLQVRLLQAIRSSLNPGAAFTTFAYLGPSLLPRGRAFRRRLEQAFGPVRTTPLVWQNIPPAFAYQCLATAIPSTVRAETG